MTQPFRSPVLPEAPRTCAWARPRLPCRRPAYRRPVFYVVVVIVFVIALLAVLANARSRRRLEALDQKPDDLKRAGDTERPPSSSGYRGPLG